MRTPHPARLALLMAFSLAVCLARVSAQEQTPPWKPGEQIGVSSETYHQVLNILFPRDALDEPGRHVFLLRYLPSFEPESQFILVEKDDSVEVVEYFSADGNINQKLNEIYQRIKREDAAELAKLIRVRQRILKIPLTEAKKLRSDFYAVSYASTNYEINHTRDDEIISDGTIYQAWYRGKGRIHYDVAGLDIDDSPASTEHPVIGWMRKVRQTLSKSAASGTATSQRSISRRLPPPP